MALSSTCATGRRLCLVTPRAVRLLASPVRSFATCTAWRAADENAVKSTGTHFRANIKNHPMYEDLPKPAEVPQQADQSAAGGVKLSGAEQYEDYVMPHLVWGKDETECVVVTHHPPVDKVDKLAYYTVKCLRFGFDVLSGYKFGNLDEIKWLRRIIFLETVAGVPGMMGAMARHLQSLRRFQRDHGWIHTLLEEAENERMHLLTALELRQPGKIFRFNVLCAQFIFTNAFFIAYLCSPRFCHRFVGYLEEDAVKTYTHCLEQLDSGHLKMWARMPAPPIAIQYWRLGDKAMMRDVILAIRADEAHHRLVNHTLGSLKPDEKNPFGPGQ